MGNPQSNIKELEQKLGKYNNSLNNIKDFSAEDYYNYVDDNYNYFASTGEDPSVYYARKVFGEKTTEAGGTYDQEYAKKLTLDQLISAIDSVSNAGSIKPVDTENEEETVSNVLDDDSNTPAVPLVPVKDPIAEHVDSLEFDFTRPLFEEAFPEYAFLSGVDDKPITSIVERRYSGDPRSMNYIRDEVEFADSQHYAGDKYYDNPGEARYTLASLEATQTGKSVNSTLSSNYGTSDSDILGMDVPDEMLQYVVKYSDLDWENLTPSEELVEMMNSEGRVQRGKPLTLAELKKIKKEYDKSKLYKEELATREKHKKQREAFSRLPGPEQDRIMREYTTLRDEYNKEALSQEELSYLFERINVEKATGTAEGKTADDYYFEIMQKIMGGFYTTKVPMRDGSVKDVTIRINPDIYVKLYDELGSAVSQYYKDNYSNTDYNSAEYMAKLQEVAYFLANSALNGEEAAVGKLAEVLNPKVVTVHESLPWWQHALTFGAYTDSGWGHALLGFKKNIVSTGAYLLGVLEGTGVAAYDLFGGDTPEYMKDLGFFERWGAYIGTSNMSEWGYGIQQTGLLPFHEQYDLALEHGVDVTRYDGHWAGFWNFMGDTGFSTAAAILSGGATALARWSTKQFSKLTAKAVAKEVMKQTTANTINKTAGILTTIGAATLVAAPEAIGNGLDVYHSVVNKGLDLLNKDIQNKVNNDFTLKEGYGISLNPEDLKNAFNDKEIYNYLKNNSSILDEMEEFYTFMQSDEFKEGYAKGEYTQEWINANYSILVEKLDKELNKAKEVWGDTKYSDFIKQSEQTIETNAWQSFAGAAAVDLVIVSVTDLFFSKVLAPSLGSLADRVGIPGRLNGRGRLLNTVITDGNPMVEATKYNMTGRFLTDVISEGFEELNTYATDETAKALGILDISNYFYNSNRAESDATLGYGIWENMSTVAGAFGDAWFSKEGWKCFGQGALGAFVGSLGGFAGSGTKMKADLQIATNGWEKFSAVAGNIWRSPIFYHTIDRRRHIVESNKAVQVVTEHLENNPEFVEALSSTEAALSYMNRYFNALVNADTLEMEENEFSMYVAQANVLAKLKGTTVGDAFFKRIKELQDATIDSELGQQIADRYIELLDVSDKSKYLEDKSKALEEAKKNINKFAEVQEGVVDMLSKMDIDYGYAVDDRTKEAIAYTYMAQENREKMLAEREDIIKEALTKKSIAKDKTPVSGLSEEQKAAVAKFGTYENAVAELEKLKAQKANKYLIQEAKEAVKLLKEFKDTETPVLNITEILQMSPSERAEFFRGRTKFSEKQKAVINKFKASGLGRHVQSAIEDAGKIQEKLDANQSIIDGLESSSVNIFRLQNTVLANNLITSARRKAGHLNTATTYEEFSKGLDGLIETGVLTPEESAIIGTHVITEDKAKEFYKKYSKEISVARSNRVMLQKLTIKVSNKKTKGIVMEVLERLSGQMRSEDDRYKFSDAENLFTDGGFIETIKTKYKVDWNTVTEREQHRILSEVKKGIDAANKALANRQDFNTRFNTEHKDRPPRRKTTKYDLFNRDVYESAKDMYDIIFGKVSRIIKGENVKLTPMEVYQLACLFDGNMLTAPIDVDTVVVKGLPTSLKSVEDLATLARVLEGRADIYEDTYDVFAQFLDGVVKWIDMCSDTVTPYQVIGSAAAELNPSMKGLFDNKSKEDVKKYERGINFKDGTRGTTITVIPPGNSALTEAQSKWYEENGVEDNIKYLLDTRSRKDVRLILVKNSELYEAEATYDDDNLPLAVAVIVPKGTKNSVEVDGVNIIYVGIAGNSRQGVSEKANILNAIRDNLLANNDDSKSWVIRYSDTNNPVEFGGWNFTYQKYKDGIITNLRERLLSKYSHLEESEREEAAYRDFCLNTVKVNCKYDVEDGVQVFKISYTWNGQDYTEKFNVTEEKVKELNESGRTEDKFSMIAYIEPNSASNQPICNLLTYDFYDTSYLGNNIAEVYDLIQKGEINIFSKEFEDSPLALIHNALVACEREIFTNTKAKEALRKNIKSSNDKDVRAASKFIEDKINGIFRGFLNLQKPRGQESRLKFETVITKDAEGKPVLNIYIKDSYTNSDIYNTKISVDALFEKDSQQRKTFLQDILFNTILKEEDGSYTYRMYKDDFGKVIPIVKMQVNYKMFNGTLGSTKDYRKHIFMSGVLSTDASWESRKVESIESRQIRDKKDKPTTETQRDGSEKEVVENTPTVVEATEAIQKALDILANFKHKGISSVEEARSTGAQGVTTFISDSNSKTLTKESLIATEIGTSLDFVVRKYIELGGDADATFNFIYDTYSKHTLKGKRVSPIQGLDWGMLRSFIDNIKTLKDTFESRGEFIVPFDTIFREVLKSEGGKHANLTAIPDIITIDSKGQLHIYDMKSYLASGISVGRYKGMNAGTEVKVARGAYFDANIGKDGKWQQQVSLYAHIIEQATGLKVASVGIIPIPVRYKTAGVNVTDTKIEAIGLTPVRALTTTTGDQFKLERVPTFTSDAIRMDILKLSEIKSSMWMDSTILEVSKIDDDEVLDDNEAAVEVAEETKAQEEESVEVIVEKIEEDQPGGDDTGLDDLGGTGRFTRRRNGRERRNSEGTNPKALKIFRCL